MEVFGGPGFTPSLSAEMGAACRVWAGGSGGLVVGGIKEGLWGSAGSGGVCLGGGSELGWVWG